VYLYNGSKYGEHDNADGYDGSKPDSVSFAERESESGGESGGKSEREPEWKPEPDAESLAW